MGTLKPDRGILALDLASKTGWAHSNGASGVWDIRHQRDESSGMMLVRLEGKVRELYKSSPFNVIAVEGMNAGRGKNANFDAVSLICKMIGVVEYLVEQNDDLELIAYNNQTIKSFALADAPTGTPRNKNSVIAAAKKRWPQVEIIDSNHADALWVLELAMDRLGFNKTKMDGDRVSHDRKPERVDGEKEAAAEQ